jgi:hypothetical protein
MSEASPRTPGLSAEAAARFASTALANIGAEYPFHLTHFARNDDDLGPPRALHPVFHGSYDWHSCVHMHWTLLRCLRRHPQACRAIAVDAFALLDARLQPANVAAEVVYFQGSGRASFERPYGWGWLLKLDAELAALATEPDDLGTRAQRWHAALAPLAALITERLQGYLTRADFAVRAGTHGNSAFAMRLALDWADVQRHRPLRAAIDSAARRWFGGDLDYPAGYEPSGDDFLSGGLCEAVLMQRALPPDDFSQWWQGFRPAPRALARWLSPAPVSDARDPKIVHLHGLNLSRAWCWRHLLPALPAALRPAVTQAIADHLAHSLPAATEGDYVGTHWLASFALLALDDVQHTA